MDPRPGAGGAPVSVGRYLIFDEIGVGGMASVHLGMLTGAVGFRRIVALKQLHSRFIHDPDFVAQFINEARLAAHIHHANVVQTLDVVWTGTQLLLVLEYVDGDTLNRVLRTAVERGLLIPIEVACSMIIGVLHGLHAAHEVRDEEGVPLDIVHRDVSPQNIVIGRDGVTRVLDFGVAKALAQSPNTQTGLLKGKFGYMAPEQILRGHVDRRTDVFAAGVVLWEALTCRRLFQSSKNVEQALARVVAEEIPPPSTYRPEISPGLDAIVMRAVNRDPTQRFQTAEELAVALERAINVASSHLVKTWFSPLASTELLQRADLIRAISKRYGPPGRQTPHPSELADEARAALASVADSRMRAARGEAPAQPSRSGKFSLGLFSARPKMNSGILEMGFSSHSARSALDDTFDPTKPSGLGDATPFMAVAADLQPMRHISARHIGGAVLALVMIAATLVTAVGWKDPPTRLKSSYINDAVGAELDGHGGLSRPLGDSAPNAPVSASRLGPGPASTYRGSEGTAVPGDARAPRSLEPGATRRAGERGEASDADLGLRQSR